MEKEIRIEVDKASNSVIALDDGAIIGHCAYSLSEEGNYVITQTKVDASYTGQGIAKRLVLALVEESKKENRKIVPVCSYATRLLLDKEEDKDLVIPE